MKKYKSEALMVIHQDAKGLHRLGIIDNDEMKEYDKGCLAEDPETSKVTEKQPVLDHVTA
jgi:DNA-binding transcriptional regulator YiaG